MLKYENSKHQMFKNWIQLFITNYDLFFDGIKEIELKLETNYNVYHFSMKINLIEA